jgi:hypothetical protein
MDERDGKGTESRSRSWPSVTAADGDRVSHSSSSPTRCAVAGGNARSVTKSRAARIVRERVGDGMGYGFWSRIAIQPVH